MVVASGGIKRQVEGALCSCQRNVHELHFADGILAQRSCVNDADNAELAWCAYAWPANFGNTGNRAFFVNQQGEILGTTANQ